MTGMVMESQTGSISSTRYTRRHIQETATPKEVGTVINRVNPGGGNGEGRSTAEGYYGTHSTHSIHPGTIGEDGSGEGKGSGRAAGINPSRPWFLNVENRDWTHMGRCDDRGKGYG